MESKDLLNTCKSAFEIHLTNRYQHNAIIQNIYVKCKMVRQFVSECEIIMTLFMALISNVSIHSLTRSLHHLLYARKYLIFGKFRI